MQASLHDTYSELVGMSIISSHPGLMNGQAPAFLMDWRARLLSCKGESAVSDAAER